MSEPYLSVEQADTIVTKTYMPNNEYRLFWEGLDIDSKNILLEKATEIIDNKNLLWKGRKKDIKQEHEFPRFYYRSFPLVTIDIPVNEKFLKGVVRLAVEGWFYQNSEETTMIKKGITSYKVKDASVTFSNNQSGSTSHTDVLGIPKDLWSLYFSEYSNIC